MTTPAEDLWTHVVTDVELDGPWPGVHSMRSFASVAVTDGARTLRGGARAPLGYANLLVELFRRARQSGTQTHVPE